MLQFATLQGAREFVALQLVVLQLTALQNARDLGGTITRDITNHS
jgi:hypothetical protein